jgi:hypothetical protein
MESLHESIQKVLNETDSLWLSRTGLPYANASNYNYPRIPTGGGVGAPRGNASMPQFWDYSRRGSPWFPNRGAQITPRQLRNPSDVAETRPSYPGRRGYGRRQQTVRTPYSYSPISTRSPYPTRGIESPGTGVNRVQTNRQPFSTTTLNTNNAAYSGDRGNRGNENVGQGPSSNWAGGEALAYWLNSSPGFGSGERWTQWLNRAPAGINVNANTNNNNTGTPVITGGPVGGRR